MLTCTSAILSPSVDIEMQLVNIHVHRSIVHYSFLQYAEIGDNWVQFLASVIVHDNVHDGLVGSV